MADFPIVGLGSSAGGLEALQAFFSAMPADSGIGFVVAAHLDPTHESLLAQLLERCTSMPVEEVSDSAAVEPDHVYVIAPNRELAIRDGVLHSRRPSAPRTHRHPVDAFFRSLARDQGERAIAIVLSGTGSNGSLGLRIVKAEGGIAIAQDPDSARFGGMPRSAISTGVVDLVLRPEKMPEALLALAEHARARPESAASQPEAELRSLIALVRKRTHRDFSGYKPRTLLRRIYRRMALHRLPSLPEYLNRLRQDGDELAALVADLTINVTGFFRDPQAWDALRETVIEPLVRERPDGSAVRLWVPGCSTGEEAYSIAMLVTEVAEALGKGLALRVFATDVSESVLATARAGLYPASVAMDVGERRLERYFERHDDTWIVRKSLREAVTFAPQNLLQDPPFSRLDLISCRNLLIYLEPEIQRKLLAVFHFALRREGHLFLGPAETISGLEDLFHPVSKKWRIFRRIGPARHDVIDIPMVPDVVEPERKPSAGSGFEPSSRPSHLMLEALVERFAPASALIDSTGRVQYLRGPTDDYLRSPSGEPSFSLFAMARDGLQAPLRSLVRQARKEQRELTAPAQVRRPDGFHPVQLIVTPMKSQRAGGERWLVSFLERRPAEDTAPPADGVRLDEPPELQAELDRTREDLRITVEQMEVSNEELRASNEEIRSINEELQASNEELETSKEELQSLNEELNTVNNQLLAKVSELEERTADLNNLLNSTEIATLFLDRKLRVRWFTPAMKLLFELLPSDVGRPITHFAQKFSGGDLAQDAGEVLAKLRPSDREVVSEADRWYIRHIVPYRTADDRIDGVAITFTDISDRKRREQEIEAAKTFAESIVDTVRESLLVLTADFRVKSANRAFYERFKVTQRDTEGRRIYELGNGQWDIPELRRVLEEVLPGDTRSESVLVEADFERIGRRVMLVNARRLDRIKQILVAIWDVTDQHRAEQELRASEERFRALVESTAQAVWETDADGSVVADSPSWRAYTGQTLEQWLGSGWLDAVHPDDRTIAARRWENAVTAAQPLDSEFRLRGPDGSWRWTNIRAAPIHDADGRVLRWVGMNLDISERKQAELERELLTRELGHRVKNMLAVVRALAMQSGGETESAEQVREAFLGRLKALSEAHGLLIDSNWRSVDLRQLVERAVAAYASNSPGRVSLEGEPVRLDSKQAQGFALILHELGTNAAKYGALSQRDGRLTIRWRIEPQAGPERRLIFTWRESQGPVVVAPKSKGFGTRLIEQAARYELGGESEIEYAVDGLRCTVRFPCE